MACRKYARNLIKYSFLLRTFYQRSSPARSILCHSSKSTSSLGKPVIFLSFIGISFGSKEDKVQVKRMSELKVQLAKADELFDSNKFQETIDFLKSLDDQQKNPQVLVRIGRALYKCSSEMSDTTKKNELIRAAYEKVKEALDLEDNDYSIHKWYAITLDAKSGLDGIKERVTQLETVQKHMRKAVELNPQDPTSRYILGEFSFGLADLPWYQRKIVSTIFATPPTGSYDEALDHFLKAEELEPDFYHTNKLMIGKCYNILKNTEKAKEFLTKASNITPENEDDRKCKEEATSLLKKVK